jgi:hypothetical protein
LGRWLTLFLGLAIAAAAGLALVSRPSPHGSAGAPPLDEIDAASRARLERVLRDAERDEPARHGSEGR